MAFERTYEVLTLYKGYERINHYKAIFDTHSKFCNNITVDVCKSLLEALAKTYLEENSILHGHEDFAPLISKVIKNTTLLQSINSIDVDSATKILKGLSTTMIGIAEFRNRYSFIGHGQSAAAEEIDPLLTFLLIECTDVWASFLISSIGQSSKSQKLIYEEHEEFNNYIDERYDDVVQIYDSKFRYSEILYNMDYQAYADALSQYDATQLLVDALEEAIKHQ